MAMTGQHDFGAGEGLTGTSWFLTGIASPFYVGGHSCDRMSIWRCTKLIDTESLTVAAREIRAVGSALNLGYAGIDR